MSGRLLFGDLHWVWLLLPLYLLWVAAWWIVPWWRRHHGASVAVRFSMLRQLRQLRPASAVLGRRLIEGLRLLSVALVMLALLRPQTGRSLTEINTEGIDIVLVIDTSGSMQALDLEPEQPIRRRRNRLEVAKTVVEEFVATRENDQLGLVVFGANAFTQCPLTLDHGILATFLERLEIGMAGDATAIGDAVGSAVKRLRDSEAAPKVVILLTDGRSNAGALSPLKAAEVARTLDVKLYTVGVGSKGQAPFLVETPLGPQVVYQDVEIDEATLRKMAELTGGSYYRAEDSAALERIYEQIDQLEKTEITMEQYMEYDEQFRWFVLPAVGLLLMETLLLGTRFRKLP